MITLAAWVLTLPLRIVWQLGLRRTLILVCLLVLTVTGYGVAEDLGLLGNPPTQARTRPGGQAPPSRAATSDIPPGYRRLYLLAARRCPGLSWAVLAAIGKVESDHGRAGLPGLSPCPCGSSGSLGFAAA